MCVCRASSIFWAAWLLWQNRGIAVHQPRGPLQPDVELSRDGGHVDLFILRDFQRGLHQTHGMSMSDVNCATIQLVMVAYVCKHCTNVSLQLYLETSILDRPSCFSYMDIWVEVNNIYIIDSHIYMASMLESACPIVQQLITYTYWSALG